MKSVVLSFLLIVLSSQLFAQNNSQAEIEHLLQYVKSTECGYERNGDMYSGEEAVAHIQKKYDYYADEIETTEDFIRYAATKSKMSGKYYLVHCTGKPEVKSRDWLLTELQRYRLDNP